MRTYIKAYMRMNFGQIPPLTTELAALERLKDRCHHVISVDINPIFFKLAGNKDMHNIMNEFEFRPDGTTDYGVSCPWASKKYPHRLIMGKMVFPLFLCCFLKWDFTLAHWTQVSDRCHHCVWATCIYVISNTFVTNDNFFELIRKISPTFNYFEFIY